jgi:GTP cyclohydrolase II
MDRTQRIQRQTVAEVPLAGLSLTNHPKKTDAFIYGGFDLEAMDQVPILPSVHEFNDRYLATNREKLGHRFPH